MDNTTDFYVRLKEARQKKGLSQADAADKLNVSRQAISRWETGKGFPDINFLTPISELYDISIDELLGHNISVPEYELPDIEEGMSKSDETSPDPSLPDDNDKTPASTSSHIKNIFNREYIFLILLLVISNFNTFIGLIVSIYVFVWTWRNRRHYKLILVLSVICILLELNNLYQVIDVFLPYNYSITVEEIS